MCRFLCGHLCSRPLSLTVEELLPFLSEVSFDFLIYLRYTKCFQSIPCFIASQVSSCFLPAENSNRTGPIVGPEPTSMIYRGFCKQTDFNCAVPSSEHCLECTQHQSRKLSMIHEKNQFLPACTLSILWAVFIPGAILMLRDCTSITHNWPWYCVPWRVPMLHTYMKNQWSQTLYIYIYIASCIDLKGESWFSIRCHVLFVYSDMVIMVHIKL